MRKLPFELSAPAVDCILLALQGQAALIQNTMAELQEQLAGNGDSTQPPLAGSTEPPTHDPIDPPSSD